VLRHCRSHSGYAPEPEVTMVYNHPCALYSAADFARVKAAIAAGTLNSRSGLPCRQTDM